MTLGWGDLAFVTGADNVPPTDFDAPPKIYFDHDPATLLPVCSTCAPYITLLVCLDSYDDFKESMTVSIVSAIGFGKV